MVRGLVAGAVLLAVSLGHADQADDVAIARRHFEAGRLYFQRGDFARACRQFQASYDLSRRPDLLYNIGRCREELHDWHRALEAYQGYLKAKPKAADRVKVEARIADLRHRLATEPLRHPASAPASPSSSPAVAMGGGGQAAARDRGWRPPAYASWLALGLAVISAGVGAYFGVRTLDRGSSDDAADSAALGANISFGLVGAASLTASGLLLWRYLPAPRERAPAQVGWQQPAVGVRRGGATLSVTF